MSRMRVGRFARRSSRIAATAIAIAIAALAAGCASDADRISDEGTVASDAPSTSVVSTAPDTDGSPDASDSPDTTGTTVVTGDTDPGEAPPAVTGTPVGSETTVFEQGNIDSGLTPYIAIAVSDLATRLGVAEDQITTVSAVLVVWPDAALGCRQPDRRYTQVPVDGALIELSVAGLSYRYHAGGSRPPFLCQQALDKSPSTLPTARPTGSTPTGEDSPTS